MSDIPSIRILCPDNGSGLSRDAAIIQRTLNERLPDVEVEWLDTRGGIVPRGTVDVQLHLEIVDERTLKSGLVNVLIPNPEWFFRNWISTLRSFDYVFCKTHHAAHVMKSYWVPQDRIVYTGFTSVDMMRKDQYRIPMFAHFAGVSEAKGTNEVIQAFKQMPDIRLTVYARGVNERRCERLTKGVNNIDVVSGKLKEEDYAIELNKHLFHVCPSTYEWFGHYINEARSVGALIITTNAEPMNELVNNTHGLLVSCTQGKKQGLVRHSIPSISSIVEAVQTLASTAHEHRVIETLSRITRERYELDDEQFKTLFIEAIQKAIIKAKKYALR